MSFGSLLKVLGLIAWHPTVAAPSGSAQPLALEHTAGVLLQETAAAPQLCLRSTAVPAALAHTSQASHIAAAGCGSCSCFGGSGQHHRP